MHTIKWLEGSEPVRPACPSSCRPETQASQCPAPHKLSFPHRRAPCPLGNLPIASGSRVLLDTWHSLFTHSSNIYEFLLCAKVYPVRQPQKKCASGSTGKDTWINMYRWSGASASGRALLQPPKWDAAHVTRGGIHWNTMCEMLSMGTGTQEVLREHQYSHYHHCYLLRGLSTDAGDKPWRVVGSSSGRGGLKGRHHIQCSHASDGSGQAPASAAPCSPHIKLPPAPQQARSLCLSCSGSHQDPCRACSDGLPLASSKPQSRPPPPGGLPWYPSSSSSPLSLRVGAIHFSTQRAFPAWFLGHQLINERGVVRTRHFEAANTGWSTTMSSPIAITSTPTGLGQALRQALYTSHLI